MNDENLSLLICDYLSEKYGVDKSVLDHADRLAQTLLRGGICIDATDIAMHQNSNAVSVGGNELRPLVLDNGKLYFQKYWIYQKAIIDRILDMAAKGTLRIICGGPGTGKTTSASKIIENDLAQNPDAKIVMAAPTGKAAFRMNESMARVGISVIKGVTIHRLLGQKRLNGSLKDIIDEPLDADIIVLDECSMIDISLMARTLCAVKDGAKLYMLGDRHQLASVEAGSVFSDICEAFLSSKNNFPITELTGSHRFDDDRGIGMLARDINGGMLETIDKLCRGQYADGDGGARFLNSINDVRGAISAGYKEFFAAKDASDALRALRKFQVLCATRMGAQHIGFIAASISKNAGGIFSPRIIIENNYIQNIFNGDVCVCDDNNAYFLNANEVRVVPKAILPKNEQAFAITIHKSQGSEYDSVLIVYPSADFNDDDSDFLTRELLYTAVTRAREKCLIFGNANLIAGSLARRVIRASGIIDNLELKMEN